MVTGRGFDASIVVWAMGESAAGQGGCDKEGENATWRPGEVEEATRGIAACGASVSAPGGGGSQRESGMREGPSALTAHAGRDPRKGQGEIPGALAPTPTSPVIPYRDEHARPRKAAKSGHPHCTYIGDAGRPTTRSYTKPT
eukprot:869819-Prymnesium_polylepis.1